MATSTTPPAIDAKGRLHTGNVGTLEADGYLRIDGRPQDTIFRGEENILDRHYRERLTGFKVPRHGEFIVDIP